MYLFKNRKYVSNVVDLRNLVVDEFHKIPYLGHPTISQDDNNHK